MPLMGSTERRARERQDTRRKILDAARALFVERGYAAVTMRKIAEKIEYTPTAIYFHFRDKPALIRELALEDFGALASEFQRIARVKDPTTRLRKTGQAYVAFGLDHPNHYRLMFMQPAPEVLEQPDMDAADADADADAYSFLRAGVEAAIAQGQLRPELQDPERVAQVLWAGVHGIVSLAIVHAAEDVPRRELEARSDLMLDALLRGMARAGS